MMNDPETKDFGLYFERMYANRATLWAYCYRKGLGINCNMHLESMHKTIKYHYLNGCKIGRLDKSIMTIRRFTRDKKVERMIKLTKGKSTTRIQEIKKRHKTSISLNLNITKNDANSWNVDSEHTPNQSYVVKKINEEICCVIVCSTCKICIHTFECTCLDYSIKSIICKHIHTIALSQENHTNKMVNSELNDINKHTADTKEIEIHMNTLNNKNENENLYEIFKKKAMSTVNKIHLIEDPDHLKEAIKKIDALNAFIDATSKQSAPNKEFIKTKTKKSKKILNKQFAVMKKTIKPTDTRIKEEKRTIIKKKINENKTATVRQVAQTSSALFFQFNTQLGPPYHILVDTNFISFSIKYKMDVVQNMMDCLYAKCIPYVTDCIVGELEKLGQKYKIALKIVKDPRFQRIQCMHPGTYADDCLVQRVTQHKCYIVATCDRDLKRRIRKIPGVPLMYIAQRRYTIERMPDAYGAPKK
ncbi:hypothetical protein ACI65C_011532 [Semiaphis heraclei]